MAGLAGYCASTSWRSSHHHNYFHDVSIGLTNCNGKGTVVLHKELDSIQRTRRINMHLCLMSFAGGIGGGKVQDDGQYGVKRRDPR